MSKNNIVNIIFYINLSSRFAKFKICAQCVSYRCLKASSKPTIFRKRHFVAKGEALFPKYRSK